MTTARRTPRALSIAGSDSGGGAGIQADLKAFAACGVHGATALTALTAQNTVSVTAIHPVPPDMIKAQVQAVAEDIAVDAVKIGMLGDERTIVAVAEALDSLMQTVTRRGGHRRQVPVVLDPVMVAESGASLLEPSARQALISLLLPRATVITPNLPEAQALVAHPPRRREPRAEELKEIASALRALGPMVVVVTGGHRDSAADLFFDGARLEEIPGPRHPDGAAHGSGCTHSSALAARLARGDDPLQAARVAKWVASEAVRRGLRDVGAGAGPVNVLADCAAAISPASL